MNTPKAAWNAAASVESPSENSPERKDTVAAPIGWDPYEVWRTRVLMQDAVLGTPAGKNEPPSRPFLIRSS